MRHAEYRQRHHMMIWMKTRLRLSAVLFVVGLHAALHYFGSFDDGRDKVALVQVQFVGAAPRDGAFDKIVADAHDHVGHNIAQLNFLDFPT